MSVRWVKGVLERGPNWATGRLVLIALAERADDDTGTCWPSQDDIRRRTAASESTVKRALARLEREGFITRSKGRGRGNTTRYTLSPVLVTEPSGEPEKGSEWTVSASEKGPNRPPSTSEKGSEWTVCQTEKGSFCSEKGSQRPPNPQEPPFEEEEEAAADARAREDADPGSSVSRPLASPDADALYDRVLAAAGHASGRQLPTWWIPPAATLHVQRWRNLGLSDDEIVEVVRQTQARFDGLTGGPKAFDRAMAAYAAEKAEPALTPTLQHMNGGKPQPPPQSKPDIYQAVIEKAIRGEL